MKPTLAELQAACPAVPAAALAEHLARLDDRYFDVFSLPHMAAHVSALAELTSEHPVAVRFEPTAHGLACTVLAYDYPAEFSLITGVLSSLGFNILSGDVFTYGWAPPAAAPRAAGPRRRRRGPPPGMGRRKIIDRFSGSVETAFAGEAWTDECRRRLTDILSLLERGTAEAAIQTRHQVNEMVARRLADLQSDQHPALYPIHIDIDQAGGYTRLRVVSQDTPAFLYTLSGALALQGISIERVRIRTQEGRIEDEVDVLDADGRPIVNPERLDRIRLSVLLTKQFTYFVGHAPDPYTALCRFEQMVESVLAVPEGGRWIETLSDPRALQELARLLGASDFVWEDFIRLQYETLLPMLKPHVEGHRFASTPDTLRRALGARLKAAHGFDAQGRALNAFKDREMFLIDLDHILNPGWDVRAFAEAVTGLAELTVRAAADLAYRRAVERFGTPRTVAGLETAWALFGLGKFGGVAMGYASDIEVLFVYGDQGRTDGPAALDNAEFFDGVVRTLTDLIKAKREGIFHVDLRLRPFGNGGPLACSLESFCRYYGPGGPAHSYERLSLVRLRCVGGEAALGARVERLRDAFVYTTQSLRMADLRELRARQLAEKTQPGRINAKFSPGALVDLEYDVQILQVLHGGQTPALRTPRIHAALAALSEAGVLTPDECGRLTDSYYFLRRLINGLRMLRGSARDLFLPPEGSDEFAHLARRMGYRRAGDLEPEQQLRVEFDAQTAVVRAFVERHFGREALPGPAVGNVADLILSDEAPAPLRAQLLGAAGFQLPDRAYVNLRHLAGDGARQWVFARLAVLAGDSLKRAADPDMALNNWERFVRALPDATAHFERLLAQPRRLDLLLSIFSASQFLAETLIRNPEFLDWATDAAHLHAPRPRAVLADDLAAFAGAAPAADWANVLRRFRRREILRIGARDICLQAPIREITADLSDLADTIADSALTRIWAETTPPPGLERTALADRFCLLAYGKLGGHELNYSSDLDLLGVCDDTVAAEPEAATVFERYNAVLKTLTAWLSAHTEEGYAYRVDFRLRPYGRAGQLVYTSASLLDYYRHKAALWEIQALLKARPVAGNRAVGEAFLERAREILLQPREPRAVIGSIETLRAMAVRTVAARGDNAVDVKTGEGGMRDIEFLTQGLQLLHAHRQPALLGGNTLQALERLQAAGLLAEETVRQLSADYAFLRKIEHVLQLFEDRQIHHLPEAPVERAALARRLWGLEGDAERLMSELRACLARVRQAYTTHLVNAL